MKNRRLCSGDLVQVRSAAEILSTLDGNGTLEGVPFMPEMLDSCGKCFHVQRRVEKTCVDGYPMRRFPGNNVVTLDGQRCSGRAHDGCMHGCRIFWKEAWLRPVDDPVQDVPRDEASLADLRARLKVKVDEDHYFCQSTELYRATQAFPGKRRLLTVRIALREIRSGDLSVAQVVRLFALWFLQKWLRAAGADKQLRGPARRTINKSLHLRPGETVRVRSRPQIAETLNPDRRNRGLGICYEMTRCCGREAEVRYRVERIIDEKTGAMREISNTVTLRNIGLGKKFGEECLCEGQLGDCPRGELMYWREMWLERPSGADPDENEPVKA